MKWLLGLALLVALNGCGDSSGPRWKSVSAAEGVTCAVSVLWLPVVLGFRRVRSAWTGATHASITPVQVGTESNWSSVSLGGEHACGTRANGTLWCWGSNIEGQLGIGTRDFSPTPVQVGTERSWASVSVGGENTCGTRTDGSLWCWGQQRGSAR